MKTDGEWRELARRDDLHSAGVIVTSIAAMEFDVSLRDVATGRLVAHSSGLGAGLPSDSPSDGNAAEETALGPFVIEVRPEDWDDLQDVLAEIIEEQGAFDALIEAREHKERRVRRAFFLLLVIGVIATVLLILLKR